MNHNCFPRVTFIASLALTIAAQAALAQPWVSVEDNTRYLALGDSLSAGYEAKPVTQGFVYQLYRTGKIDEINNLLFCGVGVPGATSADVMQYQIPQVHLFFKDTGAPYRKVVTLSVGGDDLLALLKADGTIDQTLIPGVLTTFGNNLAAILSYFALTYPDAKVYVANIYDPKLPVPDEDKLIGAVNGIIANVVSMFPNNAVLVDIFSAFEGKTGLLLNEKKKASISDVHPSNAGYDVMTEAFAQAIAKQ